MSEDLVQCRHCGDSHCGGCLRARYGESLDEARCKSGWHCPVCRDLCNCSSPNCLRSFDGLLSTGQVKSEALRLGYRSVHTPRDTHATLNMLR